MNVYSIAFININRLNYHRVDLILK